MTTIHGFTLTRETDIPELNVHVRIFRHDKTGAELLSLENDDENKVFGVSFRTPPEDSTGIAHIMEHSVLGGSREISAQGTLCPVDQRLAQDLPQRLHLAGQDDLSGGQHQLAGLLQPGRRLSGRRLPSADHAPPPGPGGLALRAWTAWTDRWSTRASSSTR